MKNSTTTMNAENIVNMLFNSIEEGSKKGITMLWDAGTSALIEHWLLVGGILIGLLVLFTLMALFGHWASLGSFLYHSIYAIIILIIGSIWGPEVFISNWFGFFTAIILYPVCYLTVGWILKITGLRY